MGCHRIVVAGTHSGVGKTSLSLALVTSLRRRGLRVQTFKVGPDFLDPSYLALASGRPCYNLDGWMTGRDYVLRLFSRATASADVAVIEGVMGLFDGAEPTASDGSTAEIARWLDAPVLLVVNAHGIARSLAAIVKGYADFDPELRVGGVIANDCGSDRHRSGLAESLKAASLPPLLGSVPRGAFPSLPSRHLGLVTADAQFLSRALLEEFADVLDRHALVPTIQERFESGPAPRTGTPLSDEPAFSKRVRIGVAQDRAFHFYYPDNFDALVSQGCELIGFSPIEDEHLPEGIDGLYIGGGYPEEYAEALAENRVMLEAIRHFATMGRPLYAECGGLMYLAEGIETRDGNRYALVGLVPAWTRMLERRKSLGYVEVTLKGDSLWGARGMKLRGHEFHYSELVGDPTGDSAWQSIYSLRRQRSNGVTHEGYQRGRILATYVHAHFACRPEAIGHFVATCEETS